MKFTFTSPRFKKLIHNVLSSFVFRFINLAISLAIVPLIVGSLKADSYAFFAVIVSASVLFTYADLGMGLSVVNQLAEYKKGRLDTSLKTLISNVYVLVLFFAALILTIGLPIVFFLYSDNDVKYMAWSALILVVALGLPFSLVQRFLFAIQRTYEANMWYTLGRAVAYLGLWFCAYNNLDLWWYVASLLGIPICINILSTISFFIRYNELRPWFNYLKFDLIPNQMKMGMKFVILQLAIFVDTGIDVILISYFYDDQTVRQFDVLLKLYIYVPGLLSILTLPIWPSIRNALAENDINWISKVARNSSRLIFVISISISSIFLCFHVEIIKIWTGLDFNLSLYVVLFISIYSVLSSLSSIQSMLMNSFEMVGFQAKVGVLFMLIIFTTKILMVMFLGIEFMVASVCVLYLLKLVILQRYLNVYFKKLNS